MTAARYAPGGDAQAIQRVAASHYGSYRNMFSAHGWDVSGDKMMTSAPALIVKEYGSIAKFEELHLAEDVMPPMQAIYETPPNVWLTSFYGFRPELWGFLGFTDDGRRRSFIEGSRPGVLVVVYGAGKAAKGDLGKIIGIQQCSHQVGGAREFMAPSEWASKSTDSERADKWNFAVKATRAWRVTPETRMTVNEFAPDATKTQAWQHIGARGVQLSRREALNILKLDLQEVGVYGEVPIVGSNPGGAREILAPSKQGPVSQTSFVTKEAEGPKHLYMLSLRGNLDAFLGAPVGGKIVVKAGFSRSPETRCADHNRALPRCAYRWEILKSGHIEGTAPYPTSDHAKAGEKAMQIALCQHPAGHSLGGEFFLATPELVETAWELGRQAAVGFQK